MSLIVPPIFRRKANGKVCRNAPTGKAFPARRPDGEPCTCCPCGKSIRLLFDGVVTVPKTVDDAVVSGAFVNSEAIIPRQPGNALMPCSYAFGVFNYPLQYTSAANPSIGTSCYVNYGIYKITPTRYYLSVAL